METPLDALGTAATAAQRDALASPLRLEIFGHFSPPDALSVRQLARRMGRSASSLYYHVHRLVDAGLLREAGERPRGTRTETLYEATASALRMAPDGSRETRDAILRTMAAGFRMAERDLEAALEGPGSSGEDGAGVPVFATRLHCRATDETLEAVKDHLRKALELIGPPEADGRAGADAGSHYSLTLALLPLRGRDRDEEPR